MTQDQAGEIVTLLTALFHRDALEAESLVIFAKDLMLLADGSIGLQAAHELGRGQDRFPTIREFRDVYHSVARQRAIGHAQERGIEAQRPGPTPEWVHVWSWARYRRDPRETRPFPQSLDPDGHPLTEDAYLTGDEYDALLAEWRAAGEPRLGSAKQLAGDVGRERQS